MQLHVLSYFSHIRLYATLWTIVCQAPQSMEFSRLEYWSGLPFPSPGNLPDPGIEPASLTSPALASRFFVTGATWEVPQHLLASPNYVICARMASTWLLILWSTDQPISLTAGCFGNAESQPPP